MNQPWEPMLPSRAAILFWSLVGLLAGCGDPSAAPSDPSPLTAALGVSACVIHADDAIKPAALGFATST